MSDLLHPKRNDPFKPVERLLEAAGVIEPDPENREKIKLIPELSRLAEKVGLVLGKSPHKLFLRGNIVMKIEYEPNQGALEFVPMGDGEFVTWVERFISFGTEVKVPDEHGDDSGKKRWVAKSIPSKTAGLILQSPQFRACLPTVTRKNRVRLPVLRAATAEHPKGKLELLPQGWDEESGVFTFPSDVKIDESWTAERACGYFAELYSEFPLSLVTVEKDGEKILRRCPNGVAACITAALAPFAEGILPANTLRCGFVATANQSGSGKSLLMKLAIAPVTGQPAGLTLSRDEKSLRTELDSVLLSGQSCVFFDNVKGYIESAPLEALMALTFWQGRTYHTQRVFTIRNETTVFISGNNATVSPDIERRFVWIELFNEQADASATQHARELDDAWLIDPHNRGDILSALWALVRHWDEAGRPPAPNWMAGFRGWCDTMVGIVASVRELSGGTIGDPLARPTSANAGDKESKHMKRLLELMIEGEAAERVEYTPALALDLAREHGLFSWFLPELPDDGAKDELKHPEKVKFGKIVSGRCAPGDEGKAVKYLLTADGKTQLWRFCWEGEGRHKKYVLTVD